MPRLHLLFTLVLSQMFLHPGRALVTILGVSASACAVIWVVSGYDALVTQFDENAGKYLGRYDMLVVPSAPPGGAAFVDQALVDRLHQDAGVLELNPVSQARVTVARVPMLGDPDQEERTLDLLVGSRPPVHGAPPIDPVLVATPATEPPYEMIEGTWLAANGTIPGDATTGSDAAVLSAGAAEATGASMGDEIFITSLANQVRVRVAGIVTQAPDAPSLNAGGGGPPGGRGRAAPKPEASDDNGSTADADTSTRIGIPTAFVQGVATHAVYVRPELAARINGFPSRPTVLQVALRDTVTVDEFRRAWQEPFSTHEPPLRLADFSMVRSGLESSRSMGIQRSQAIAATGFASLTAVFIIFSLLSMGVSERTREFALLRTVAYSRAQIAALVTLESLILAGIGWAAGIAAGALLIFAANHFAPSLVATGAAVGWGSLLSSGATVGLGAVGAAVLPAWRATRIDPLEALSSARVSAPRRRWQWLATVVAVGLLVLVPMTVFYFPLSDQWRIWVYATVTYPALLLGMVLITPAVVAACGRLLGPVAAWIVGLDSRLLHSQLRANLWRTAGAALALSVGLALFVSTQSWGHSMLQPFLPGRWLPDMLVAFHPVGIDDEAVAEIADIPGIESDQVMPLAIEQARFEWGPDGGPPRLQHDNAVLFGIDPRALSDGPDSMLDLEFVEGDPERATQAIAAGGACLISEDFQITTGKQVGDSIAFRPPNASDQVVTYRIAGVVSLPGWHWITKFSGVRRHFVRTATMVFASREAIKRDFHLTKTEFCWLNLEPNADRPAIESALQRLAARERGETFHAAGFGAVTAYRPFARATATATVRKAITMHAKDMIWSMSQLPLLTLAVMSLAVVNTMIASVRARQWEFGVLRSIGTTRSQLVRLVVAETVLIGIAACVISLVFGLTAGWCGVGMARYQGWFAGPPTYLIPWSHLTIGFAMAIGLCLLSALWPAARIGSMEPLTLLKAGRGAR